MRANTASQRALYLVAITVIVCCMLLWIFGCAQAPVVAPSTAPLQSNLGSAQTHITQSRTLAQRIHDKDVLIDRWNATHSKP